MAIRPHQGPRVLSCLETAPAFFAPPRPSFQSLTSQKVFPVPAKSRRRHGGVCVDSCRGRGLVTLGHRFWLAAWIWCWELATASHRQNCGLEGWIKGRAVAETLTSFPRRATGPGTKGGEGTGSALAWPVGPTPYRPNCPLLQPCPSYFSWMGLSGAWRMTAHHPPASRNRRPSRAPRILPFGPVHFCLCVPHLSVLPTALIPIVRKALLPA